MKCTIIIACLVSALSVSAHPGKTDANGGHTNKKTGDYHYHGGGSRSSGSGSSSSYRSYTAPMLTPPPQASPRAATPPAVAPSAQGTLMRPRTQADTDLQQLRLDKFRLEQATNGMPTAQFIVGTNYVFGTKNFPKNKTLGIYWLGESAKQGNADAARVLDSIKTNAVVLESPE